jgi:nicotinate-nucleotide adenylyltransferase
MKRQMKRVGLLGGAFDPPHEGHLRLAHLAWEYLALDALRFLPAFIAPLKPEPAAPAAVRLEMLRQMLAGSPYTIEDSELSRPGPSYTIDTLESLRTREPDAAWVLLMGSDQAAGFGSWVSAARILEMASIAIAARPGSSGQPSLPLPGILSGRLSKEWSGAPGEAILLPSTDLELSSSKIRRQLATGEEPIGLAPLVKNAVMQNDIYRLNT